jgi:hypothetical protein
MGRARGTERPGAGDPAGRQTGRYGITGHQRARREGAGRRTWDAMSR